MSLVKVQHKGQMTIPRNIRSQVGLAEGDLVEVKAARGRIILTPKLVIDPSKFANADDEYTPEQHRLINARLDEAEKGPYYGPFKNGAEVAAFLKKTVRVQEKAQPAKRKKRR